MAACKYCGEWAGIVGDVHQDCEQWAGEGKTTAEIRALRNPAVPVAATAPVTTRTIAFGVFYGLLLYSAVAGIVAAFVAFVFDVSSAVGR